MSTAGGTAVGAEVKGLRRSLGEVCARLDPPSVPLPEVCELWAAFDALERLAAGAKCRLAARVAESRTWQDRGERSPAEWMAHTSGTTTGRNRAALEASKALGALPATDAALAGGELSDQQAEAICGAAGAGGADPADEARLLDIARRRELRELREAAARVRARAEDDAERAKRLRRQRFLRTWTAADGSWNLSVRNTPEVGAELEAALAPLRESIFQAARRAAHHESTEAYGADALAELVRRSAGAEDATRAAARGAGADQGQRKGRAGDATDAQGAGDSQAEGGAGTGGDSGAFGSGEPGGETGGEPGGTSAGGGGGAEAGTAMAPDHDGGDDRSDGATAGGQLARSGRDSRAVDDQAVDDVAPLSEDSHPAPGRSRRPDTKVIVLIDHEAMKRGWVEGDERCEIAGVGPVSVATARSLMADCFGAAIVTNGVDVFTAAHLGRSVTEHQRSALEARGYRCEVPGCGATRGLEIDHIEDWHKSFRTALEFLGWLCRAHHLDKTHRGWRLEGPPGDRRWIGPRQRAG